MALNPIIKKECVKKKIKVGKEKRKQKRKIGEILIARV